MRRREVSKDLKPEKNMKSSSDSKTEREKATLVARKQSRPALQLVFVAFAVFGIYLVSKSGIATSSLPKTYALCSREGGIYTVDENQPTAECIVIHDSRILSVGSLGKLLLSHCNPIHLYNEK